jgi:hypothetical protein
MRKIQENYIKKELAWVKKHLGETLKIIKEPVDNENGWNNTWPEDFNRFLGETIEISLNIIQPNGRGLLGPEGYCFPYFILYDLNIQRLEKLEDL